MDTFLTTQKAAERLGVGDSRIRQLILDGKLVAVKAGRDWLIKASDLRLQENRKTKPGPAAKANRNSTRKRQRLTTAARKQRSGR